MIEQEGSRKGFPDDGSQDVLALIRETPIIPIALAMGSVKSMVCEVNRTQVIPKERLSDSVYFYDGKELSVCCEAEGSVA